MRNFLRLSATLGFTLAVLAVVLFGLSPSAARASTTFTVSSLGDAPDAAPDGVCDIGDGSCTLRAAVQEANNTSGADTIVFSVTGVITITGAGLPALTDIAGVIIDGDTDGNGLPNIGLDGRGTVPGDVSGFNIQSPNNRIQSLAIYGFRSFGVIITGALATDNQILSSTIGLNLANAAIGNGTPGAGNGDGIIIRSDASKNIVQNNTLAGNLRHGISINSAGVNTVTQNYIGVTAGGLDRGNGSDGIRLQANASQNLVQNNQIKFNGLYGIELIGNHTESNRLIGNTVMSHDFAGIYSSLTHINGEVSVPASGDNLIQGNQVLSNTGPGIYNIGASPLITANIILTNGGYGIDNVADYGGTLSPAGSGDDRLSMPGIYNNTINNNAGGIRSTDTAPLNRTTLGANNSIGNNKNLPDVSQTWYGAVEVLSGTTTIDSGINVTLTSRAGAQVLASTYASAGGPPEQGIWSKLGTSYNVVTSWLALDEFTILSNGTLVNHSPYTITVSGAYNGSFVFSYDADNNTHPVSPDHNLPIGLLTGITAVPAHTLHRYQIAEVNFGQDSDGDGISDAVEGYDDPDGDDLPNYLDPDSDGDGIDDAVEGAGDADGDSTPNFLDLDSDGNGVSDSVEGDGNVDGDSAADFLDLNNDNDGIPDLTEVTCTPGVGSGFPCNSDTDGTPDYNDTDSDGDGLADSIEGTGDPDGDNKPNYRDTDSDNNGILDEDETDPTGSVDADGIPNFRDLDDDGDNINDAAEYYFGAGDTAFCSNTTLDSDGDNTPNCTDNDVDEDGTPNYRDTDSDGDTLADGSITEGTSDFDGDGVPNWIDPQRVVFLPIVVRNQP